MCGRMSLFKPATDLEGRFGTTFDYMLDERYNIAPRSDLDTVPNDDPEHARRMSWGILPHWVDDPDNSPRPINARAETVASKPSFPGRLPGASVSRARRRVLRVEGIPGAKRPYRIERADDEPFAFAGLWETWGSNGDDDELETVTIVTTEPNDLMEPIHDRMPVILEPEEEQRWLEEDDVHELQAMLDPFPAGLLDAYEVSTEVNDPSNDSPAVIEPLGHDQSGLGQFS